MDTLVMYYSFTGRSRYEAKRMSKELGADIYEIHEQRHRAPYNAYLFGPGQARGRKFVYIEPVAIDLEDYDKIILVCPVWGGYPAPAFNNMVNELPPDKDVEVYLTSDSGKVKAKDETIMLVERQGVKVVKFEVIKTLDLNKRDKLHMKKLHKEKKLQEKLEKKNKAKGIPSGEAQAEAPENAAEPAEPASES